MQWWILYRPVAGVNLAHGYMSALQTILFAKVLAMHAVTGSGEHQPLPSAFSRAVGELPCCKALKHLLSHSSFPASLQGLGQGC